MVSQRPDLTCRPDGGAWRSASFCARCAPAGQLWAPECVGCGRLGGGPIVVLGPEALPRMPADDRLMTGYAGKLPGTCAGSAGRSPPMTRVVASPMAPWCAARTALGRIG